MKRFVPVVAALGLVASGLLTSSVAAKSAGPTVPSAGAVICKTQVIGVLPNGRLVKRLVTNTRFDSEKVTAAPLPFKVDYLFGWNSEQITGGRQYWWYAFTAGQAARRITVRDLDAEPTLAKPTVVARYRPTMNARLLADSGTYYTYGVDRRGNLMRWTKYIDDHGQYWFDTEHPKLVARNMGSLKTLSFMLTSRLSDGIRRDVLYGTTNAGALKQVQIPWGTPGKSKVTTVKTTGFASYTSLSLSWCNDSGSIGSIIAIDKVNNRARWYHLTSQYRPNVNNLVRHPLVAPGRNWRLHATF